MKKIIFLLAVMLSFSKIFSQQQAIYTQYMFNHVAVNPAYAASKENITAMLLARAQWVNFEGAPISQTLTLHGPAKPQRIGFGFSVLNDKIGVTNQTGAYVDFAFQFNVSENLKIALGLKGGFDFYRADLTKLNVIEKNDPRFSEDVVENFKPNFGCGAFLYSDRYYIGFSIPKLLRNQININSDIISNGNSFEERHYFIIAGYVFDVNSNVKFKPSILGKIVTGSPSSWDLNGSFLIKNRLWLGATYRLNDAISAMVEVKVSERFLIGYAFDFSATEMMGFNYGTHEILISYEFNFNKFRVKSPRYF